MKVIIVGAGFVGMKLARTLVAEGRDVVLIDKDAERVVLVAPKGDENALRIFGDR